MRSLSHAAGRFLSRLPGGNWCLNRAAGGHDLRCSPIFMLHRVLPDSTSVYDREMAVSTFGFEQLLAWLREHYEVVRLGDLLGEQMNRGKPLCALTFDDGWCDTYTEAFPRLQRWGMPATVFLPLHFIGTDRRFWQESLFFHLRQLRVRSDAAAQLQQIAAEFAWCPLLSSDDLHYGRLSRRLRRRASSEAEAFVARLGESAGRSLELVGRAFMNWDEVRTMQRAGIEF
ncbi:MAG: polysaccharide deacetylase family protein, partial [Terriglobales bacterium]